MSLVDKFSLTLPSPKERVLNCGISKVLSFEEDLGEAKTDKIKKKLS
jgi:hypothetical protein